MHCLRFRQLPGNAWSVSESAKPIATVTRSRGRCAVQITDGHVLDREELAALLDFATEREQT